MNPLKAEIAVSEVFKYDHVQVDVIKHYMELADFSAISKLFICQIKKNIFNLLFLWSFSLFQWLHNPLPNPDSSLCVCVCVPLYLSGWI